MSVPVVNSDVPLDMKLVLRVAALFGAGGAAVDGDIPEGALCPLTEVAGIQVLQHRDGELGLEVVVIRVTRAVEA